MNKSDVSSPLTQELEREQARRTVLVDAETGARRGLVTLYGLGPAAATEHLHEDGESALLVLEGEVAMRSADGQELRLAGGAAAYLPPATSCTLSNPGAAPARLLVAEERLEELPEGGVPRAAGKSRRVTADPSDPEGAPIAEYEGFTVQRLVSDQTVASERLVLGTSEYEAEVTQPLHRHLGAEEFVLITAGEMLHANDEGETPVRAGEIAFIPHDEWHGVVTPAGSGCSMAYGYLGAAGRESAGFETREEQGEG